MTPEKVREVLATYHRVFEDMGLRKIDYPHDELLDTMEHGLSHCYGMLDKIGEFVQGGHMEKAFRWLGFIQGVVWADKMYTLTNLMDHNRPKEAFPVII
jgi:hypothetical protein